MVDLERRDEGNARLVLLRTGMARSNQHSAFLRLLLSCLHQVFTFDELLRDPLKKCSYARAKAPIPPARTRPIHPFTTLLSASPQKERRQGMNPPSSNPFAPAEWLVLAAFGPEEGTAVVVTAVVEIDVPSPPTPVVVAEERETPDASVVAVFGYDVPPTVEPVVVTVAPVSWADVRLRRLRSTATKWIGVIMATVRLRVQGRVLNWPLVGKELWAAGLQFGSVGCNYDTYTNPSYHRTVNHVHSWLRSFAWLTAMISRRWALVVNEHTTKIPKGGLLPSSLVMETKGVGFGSFDSSRCRDKARSGMIRDDQG